MNTLFIIGMPGSGKSSLGRKVAERLGVAWHDMDVYFERQTGMSSGDFIRTRGEASFRDMESETLRRCVRKEAAEGKTALILSTGGGVVEREENIRLMRQSGLVAYLHRPVQTIAGSVPLDGKTRPLLTGTGDLEEIWKKRQPLYVKASHFQIENTGSFPGVLERLISLSRLALGQMDYGVVGDPIAHSLSPALHQVLYEEIGERLSYGRARIRRGDLDACTQILRSGALGGINVTSPLKIAILPILDKLMGDAHAAGAVNTVRMEKDGLTGYNTDMEGLRLAIERRGKKYEGAKMVVLGSGGAAAGIVGKARERGAREIIVAARNQNRAERMVGSAGFSAADGKPATETEMEIGGSRWPPVRILPFPGSGEADGDMLRETDILINATTLGAAGREGGPPEREFGSLDFLAGLPDGALVCDLIYNPQETRLLQAAKARGLAVMNGLDMLILQGILADEIFLGKQLDRERLRAAARAALEDKIRANHTQEDKTAPNHTQGDKTAPNHMQEG